MGIHQVIRIFIFLVLLAGISRPQMVPYGLMGYKITSLSVSENLAGPSHLLVAGTEENGVLGREMHFADSAWFSLGLEDKGISSVFVQTVGSGPADYYQLYAAIKPDSLKSGMIYTKSFLLNDADWINIDSGLVAKDEQSVRNICGFHFSGHEPPAAVFCHLDDTIYRAYPLRNVRWDSLARYYGLQTLKSFPHGLLWGGGSTVFFAPFLIHSADNGNNWDPFSPDLGDDGGDNTCFSIAIDPQHPDTVYAGLIDHVIKSVDGGKIWQVTGLKDKEVIFYAVAVNALVPSHVMAGGANAQNKLALFESFDGGESWMEVFDLSTIPSKQAHVTSIAGQLVEDNYVFFIGTYGDGIYTRAYPITDVGDAAVTNTPNRFVLYQNYPNPFNALTTVTFELSQATYVELSVYNISGQRVATLMTDKRNGGKHRVFWNASALNSGVYMIHLQTEKYNQTIKSILLK